MNPTLYCTKCGAPNAAEAQFCSRCGTALAPVIAAASAGIRSQASAAAATVSYPPHSLFQITYAGFWIRVVAFIIDLVVVRLVLTPFTFLLGLGFGLHPLGGIMGGRFPDRIDMHLLFGVGTVLWAISALANWLYEAFLLSSPYQATLGKMIFGMKVTDLNGNRISFGRATVRHFGKWLSGMLLGIGFIMVAVTPRKQGLHDILAGTVVGRFTA